VKEGIAMKKSILFSIQICISISICSCAPKVYIIDRQTVLQEQAAGEWPKFEKTLLPKVKHKKPINFSKSSESENKKDQRLYRVLNGEMGVTQ
jgi:hypothetical protein